MRANDLKKMLDENPNAEIIGFTVKGRDGGQITSWIGGDLNPREYISDLVQVLTTISAELGRPILTSVQTKTPSGTDVKKMSVAVGDGELEDLIAIIGCGKDTPETSESTRFKRFIDVEPEVDRLPAMQGLSFSVSLEAMCWE